MKRRAIVGIAALLFLLAACRPAAGVSGKQENPKQKKTDKPGVVTVQADNEGPLIPEGITGVWQMKEIPLPENYGATDGVVFADGQYRANLCLQDEFGSYYVDYARKQIAFGRDGSDPAVADAQTVVTMAGGELVHQRWEAGGLLFALSEGTGNLRIVSYGVILGEVSLPALFPPDAQNLGGSAELEMLDVIAEEARYFVLTTRGVTALDGTGRVLWKQTEKKGSCALVMTDAGLCWLANGENGRTLWRLDEDSGQITEEIALPTAVANSRGIGNTMRGATLFPGDETYDFYAAAASGLWGMTLGETKNGGHTCSGTELVNWLASGVSPDTLSAVAVADAESVAAVRLTWEGRRYDLLLFTPAEEERMPLTVAVFAESAGVRQRINEAVGAFNRTNGDYAAVLVDFTVYQADVRMTLFNAEMAAGRIPDAVIIEKRDADDDTVWTYAHNGVLCDLAPILSERSSFRYDKLLGFRTKPYTENGEQRAFPLSAQIMTNFAAAGDLSGPMTAEETVEAIRALPEGVRWTPQHFFRHDILTGIMSDFVDWNTFTCSFGDGRFAAILASLDTLEEGRREQGAVSTAWQAWSAVGEGRVRTNYDSASSLVEYAVIRAFVGGEVAAVGFPNAQRQLLVNNSGGTFFGIPEASEHKDGAAALLETILGTLRDGGATFYPEDVAADFEAVRDKTVVLSNAGRTLVDDDAVPESTVLAFKVTEDDRDAYLAFLDAIDGVLATDTPVWEIYAEECFDGRDRKPEDVAAVIQSRVAILLAERS